MKTPENDQIAPNQLEIKCFIWFSGCVLLIKCVSYNDNKMNGCQMNGRVEI